MNHSNIENFLLDISKKEPPISSWPKLLLEVRQYQREHKITIRKSDLVAAYRSLNLNNPTLFQCLIKKPMRKQSGVMVVTIFTSGHPTFKDANGDTITQKFSCKHDCWYCPLEKASPENNWVEQPRSYLTREPGVLRANANGYDCVRQMHARLEQYVSMGMDIDKLEVLVLGGTWSEYPKEYQEEFIRDIYYAANCFLNPRIERYSIEKEQNLNEKTPNIPHIIGLTLETRPDTITLDEIIRLRRFGCTRVQLGIQHSNNTILKKCNRGHTVEQSMDAINLLKQNGYKIDIHLMPNLRGASMEIDYQMFLDILTHPNLQADQWKIYPCSVTPWSKFEKMYQEGSYVPYSDEILTELLLKVKPLVHPWIRINRIIRDIPMGYISGGCSIPHLREILAKKLKERGETCRCIRCREIKLEVIKDVKKMIKIRKYPASNGIEYFISYETEDETKIFGFCRLRIQFIKNDILPELANTALIRELHSYGPMKPVRTTDSDEVKFGFVSNQHGGIGKLLLKKAENIAILNGYKYAAVIAGIGVREYYKKLGYLEVTPNGYLKKRFGCKAYLSACFSCCFNLWFFVVKSVMF